MTTHHIEVDDEVLAYLHIRAEDIRAQEGPLVDTRPIAILRRDLLSRRRPGRAPADSARAPGVLGIPDFQIGTPAALQQILEVTYLVRNSRRSRSDATHEVARRHQVAPQTVLDKYCRQLGLSASDFDRVLAQDDLRDLRSLLRKKFTGYEASIDSFLDAATGT
jgi:hypothetical protein